LDSVRNITNIWRMHIGEYRRRRSTIEIVETHSIHISISSLRAQTKKK